MIRSSVEESGCRFCAACVEVCPTGALTDRSPEKRQGRLPPMPGRNRLSNLRVPRQPCRLIRGQSAAKEKKKQFPAGPHARPTLMFPAHPRLIARGLIDEAGALIRQKAPFASILGRVCMHPASRYCRRADLDGPVAICALKRFAADSDAGLWKTGFKPR